MESKKGRPPKAPSGSATMHITVRVTAQLLADLDRARGSQTRADWVRALIAERLEPPQSGVVPLPEVQHPVPMPVVEPPAPPRKKKSVSAKSGRVSEPDHRHQWVGALGRKHCRVCGVSA